MIVAPNSPIPRANESAQPAPSPPPASGSATRKKVRAGAGTERAGGRGQVRVDGLERRDRSAKVERARDEDDGEHDGDLGERDREPERRELVAEQPEAAERREQPDPGDGGRQHERQLDQRDRERRGR